MKAAVVDVPLAGSIVAGARPKLPAASLNVAARSAQAGVSLGWALVLAVVGGLLLNLMPCVFPVLSLKVLGFARHGDSPSTMRAEAVAFGSGQAGTSGRSSPTTST